MQPKVIREEGVSTEGFAQVSLACGLACERLMIGVEGTNPVRVAPALDRLFKPVSKFEEERAHRSIHLLFLLQLLP